MCKVLETIGRIVRIDIKILEPIFSHFLFAQESHYNKIKNEKPRVPAATPKNLKWYHLPKWVIAIVVCVWISLMFAGFCAGLYLGEQLQVYYKMPAPHSGLTLEKFLKLLGW